MRSVRVTRKKVIIVKICAVNDRNGNPQRGWLVSDAKTGQTIAFCDEGYSGRSAVSVPFPNAIDIGEIAVTPGEYKANLAAPYARRS